jgi:hypothetical protein
MRIALQITRSLIPPVHYLLSAVDDGRFSYRYYGVRHPGGIFSNHFLDVLGAFNLLAGAVNNMQASAAPSGDEEVDRLRSLTQDLLFQLTNYFECGYEIFLCFCSQHERPNPGQPLYTWFRSNGYGDEVRSYFMHTTPDLKKYRDFFNGLKHTSNRVRIFQFLNPKVGRKLLGFYLEGVDERGALGPVVAFHPLYQGGRTAWSYNFHLRSLYFLIYKIAAEMVPVINTLCHRSGVLLSPPNAPFVSPALETMASSAVSNTVRRFESVFGTFFPQEAIENARSVLIDPNDGSMMFSEYLVGDKAISPNQGWGALMSTTGDGFSRSWALPYLKPGV